MSADAESQKPLAIDLCCGLGGWTAGLLAEGFCVVGYDIERHEYGDERYPGELVLQDVLTLDGARFAAAALIVASPPCQEFSYMAMPWKRGKQIARALRGPDGDAAGGRPEFPAGYRGSRTIAELTALFDACFRIQREASAAAGRRIPMVVENVRGAEPWVGRARWSFGSYYLWGDVPALMPHTIKGSVMKAGIAHRANGATNFHGHSGGNDGSKNPGFRFDGSGRSFQSESVARHVGEGRKHHGDWFRDPDCPSRQGGQSKPAEARKGAGAEWFDANLCSLPSKSPRRKAASAKIAKIPLALSRHIARVYRPAESPAPAPPAGIRGAESGAKTGA